MSWRAVFGLGWSLTCGLAGGWLVLSPWSLAQQQGGNWTTLTKNEVGVGLGLILFALIGIAMVATQAVRCLREAGVLQPRPTRSRAPATAPTSPEMERALIALAQALAHDLDQRRPEPSDRQPTQPVTRPWGEQR